LKIDHAKLKEYDDEFERNMESIEQAQKRLDTKLQEKNKEANRVQ
jgi:hypothetical protein